MSGYYRFNKTPGTRPVESNVEKYKFLLSDELADRLYKFKEGSIRKVDLFLPAIHCSSCIWLLENLYKVRSGILNSEVNFIRKRCSITFDVDQVTLLELAELLDKIGYPAHFEAADEAAPGTNYKLYTRLAVAGFAFGNIMLMSFPEYLSTDDSFAKDFRPFFSYFILALSIPVLLYSLRDYLVSAYKALRIGTLNLDVPIAMGILSLYGRSLWDIVNGVGPGYMDSFAGFAFLLLIGKWFQDKTYEALSFERDYKSYFPMAVTKINGQKREIIPIERIAKDDLLYIRNEEIIPADSVIISGNAHIDYSFVTGEARPIPKVKGDAVYAGGKQLGGAIQVRVLKAVDQGHLTGLWNQKVFNKEAQNNLTHWTESLSFYFILIVLVTAVLSSIAWLWIDATQIFNVLVSVLIVACPCALALAIPFTFGNVIRIAGWHKMYIKNTDVVEQLGKVTDIVFDKTGTITYNKRSEVQWVGSPLSENERNVICSLVHNSMHPLSMAIYETLYSSHTQAFPIEEFNEIAGLGIQGKYGDNIFKIGASAWLGNDVDREDDHLTTRVYVSKNNTILGYFQMANAYREGFIKSAPELGHNYTVHLLSGDNDGEKTKLLQWFKDERKMHFNISPQGKLEYIKKLKENGKVVMMLGDGLNDSGALKESNVGVVVSENVHNFSPASDIILSSSELKRLPQFLNLGKYGIRVLIWSYVFSFLYNIIGLFFAITNHLTPLVAAILMPLSSISVVVFTTISLWLYKRMHFDK